MSKGGRKENKERVGDKEKEKLGEKGIRGSGSGGEREREQEAKAEWGRKGNGRNYKQVTCLNSHITTVTCHNSHITTVTCHKFSYRHSNLK